MKLTTARCMKNIKNMHLRVAEILVRMPIFVVSVIIRFMSKVEKIVEYLLYRNIVFYEKINAENISLKAPHL
jgi:hypothetical protein